MPCPSERMQLVQDVMGIRKLGPRLSLLFLPILHDHGKARRSASFARLLDERDI